MGQSAVTVSNEGAALFRLLQQSSLKYQPFPVTPTQTLASILFGKERHAVKRALYDTKSFSAVPAITLAGSRYSVTYWSLERISKPYIQWSRVTFMT